MTTNKSRDMTRIEKIRAIRNQESVSLREASRILSRREAKEELERLKELLPGVQNIYGIHAVLGSLIEIIEELVADK